LITNKCRSMPNSDRSRAAYPEDRLSRGRAMVVIGLLSAGAWILLIGIVMALLTVSPGHDIE